VRLTSLKESATDLHEVVARLARCRRISVWEEAWRTSNRRRASRDSAEPRLSVEDPENGALLQCAVKTHSRQAPCGPTDASIWMLSERMADSAFAGDGVGLLWTITAAIVETDSVGGPARQYRRGRAINHVIRVHVMRNIWTFQPHGSYIMGCWKCSKICWKGGGSIIARGHPANDLIALVPVGARPAPSLKPVVWQPHVKRGAADTAAASTRWGSRRHGGTHEAPFPFRCGTPWRRHGAGPCRRAGHSWSLKCTSQGDFRHTLRSGGPAAPSAPRPTPAHEGPPRGRPSAARWGAPWAAIGSTGQSGITTVPRMELGPQRLTLVVIHSRTQTSLRPPSSCTSRFATCSRLIRPCGTER